MQVYNDAGEPATNNEGYAEQRCNMLELVGGAIKFEARAKKVFGHKPAATMVRQLLFWGDKGHDPEGYIYKTYREWWDEEGLTRTELNTARCKLGVEGFGVLEEQRKGVPCKLYYRLDLERLREVMFPELDSPTAEDPVPEDQTLNFRSRVQDSCELVRSIPTNKFAGFSPSHYREYTKKTSKNPPGDADAPQGEESKREDQTPESSKASTLLAKSEDQQPAAKRLVSKLVSDLEAQAAFLDEEQRGKYGVNFKALITKGVDAGELEEVRRRIVSEWSRIELSPQMALSDLRGGRGDTKTQVTPPEGVEAIHNYEITRYAPDDSVGPSIAADRENLAKVAERWDFTSDEEPPMKIRLQISDYPQECDEMIPRLRRIARRGVRKVGMEKMGAFNDPVSSVTPTESVSPALEEAPEGSSTPEAAEGDSTTGAVERLLSDPESKAARLARAVVAGKSSPQGPITTEDVSAALLDEVDLEALGWPASLGREREMSTRMMAAILIRRLRDQAGEE